MLPGRELLRFNHAGAMLLKNGQTVNYGVIRIENEQLVYYTGRGLREMWQPTMTPEQRQHAQELQRIANDPHGEQTLINSGHIAITPLNQIERILF